MGRIDGNASDFDVHFHDFDAADAASFEGKGLLELIFIVCKKINCLLAPSTATATAAQKPPQQQQQKCPPETTTTGENLLLPFFLFFFCC